MTHQDRDGLVRGPKSNDATTGPTLAERTRPWQPDELCIVNGMPMAYGFAGSVLMVRLPGGRAATVAELRELGHTVTLPARIRGWGRA